MDDGGSVSFLPTPDGNVVVVGTDDSGQMTNATPGYATGQAAGETLASIVQALGWLPWVAAGLLVLLVIKK
jgi:hypothetical protein